MLLTIGKRYLFMGQRYCYVGTVVAQTPTHCVLGDDAIICYEDVGGLEGWASGNRKSALSGKQGAVPGQGVCMLGCDWTPVP